MLSGVNTLLQIGAGIVIGLVLYSTVFMGLVVPALANLIGEANWWPFRKREAIKLRAQTAKGSLEEKSSRLIKQKHRRIVKQCSCLTLNLTKRLFPLRADALAASVGGETASFVVRP